MRDIDPILIGILIILGSICGLVLAAAFVSYHMTATVESEEAKAYLDLACTIPLTTPYDWGSVTDGTAVSIWIRNDGTVTVDVTLTITGEIDCTVTPSWTATTLTTGQVQSLDLTISTVATPGTEISWDLSVDSVKV